MGGIPIALPIGSWSLFVDIIVDADVVFNAVSMPAAAATTSASGEQQE